MSKQHIADVIQIAHSPETWLARCRCREWDYTSQSTAEIQRLFDAHKAQPFPAPDYRGLVCLYFQSECCCICEHSSNSREELNWLLDKCNSWLEQEGYLPFTPEEIESWLP